MKNFFSQYRALLTATKEIWMLYGGLRALLGSPFFHASLVVSAVSFGAWRDAHWWELGISVVPAILGFSIGTFAIFVAIGDEKFRELLAKGGKKRVQSVRDVYSSFVFLIFIQVLSVVFCFFAGARPLTSMLLFLGLSLEELQPWFVSVLKFVAIVFRFFGYSLIVYSLFSIVPMTLSVFRMGSLYLGFLLGQQETNKNAIEKNENTPGQ